MLSDRKGVNVPGVVLPLSAMTDKDRASPWRQFGVPLQQIVKGHIQCGGEGVQIGVHESLQSSSCFATPSLGTLTPRVTYATPVTLESII